MNLAYTARFIPHDITEEEIKALDNVKGIILNGGENRVVDGKRSGSKTRALYMGLSGNFRRLSCIQMRRSF